MSDIPNVDNVIREPENNYIGGWEDGWDSEYDPSQTPSKPTQSSVLVGLIYRANNKMLSNPKCFDTATYNYDSQDLKTDYFNFSYES